MELAAVFCFTASAETVELDGVAGAARLANAASVPNSEPSAVTFAGAARVANAASVPNSEPSAVTFAGAARVANAASVPNSEPSAVTFAGAPASGIVAGVTFCILVLAGDLLLVSGSALGDDDAGTWLRCAIASGTYPSGGVNWLVPGGTAPASLRLLIAVFAVTRASLPLLIYPRS